MLWIKFLRAVFPIQLVLLVVVTGALMGYRPEIASRYYLYEIFGALLASTITVFGLLGMKRLTGE